MRVLVCGGRDYHESTALLATLDGINAKTPISLLITGGARGADEVGRLWALDRQVNHLVYPAKWNKHGPSAGPRRNQEMLDRSKPHLVVAAPGGRGTRDMVRRAKRAGVDVVEVPES